MRPIKFRAWDKEGDGMFYDIQNGIAFDDGSHYCFDNVLNPKSGDVHDWVVMQFTGLHDKNGKAIFHNDIGRDKRGNIWRIDERPKMTGFGATCISDSGAHEELYPEDIGEWWINSHDFEVLGNIYENPELLKETK